MVDTPPVFAKYGEQEYHRVERDVLPHTVATGCSLLQKLASVSATGAFSPDSREGMYHVPCTMYRVCPSVITGLMARPGP